MEGFAAEGNEIAPEASSLVAELEVEVNLVKVVADAVEHSTRADRGEVFIAQAVVAVDQVLDAIGFGQKLSAVKGININFGGGGLITADEMSRQPDAGDGQAQAPSEQNVKQAQVDGVACPAVYNAVQVTVLGVVIILLVAGEAKLLEEVLIDGGQHRLRLSIEIQPLAQFGRITVQQGLVGLDVESGCAGLRQEPSALLKVQFLSLLEAKCKEAVIGGLAIEVDLEQGAWLL